MSALLVRIISRGKNGLSTFLSESDKPETGELIHNATLSENTSLFQ